jgi:hypothetical protein
MSTAISSFRDPIRAFLGDFNADVRRYADGAIDAVVKTLIKCGTVQGYAVTQDNLEITPSVTDPADYARIVYHSCLRFVAPNAASYRYDTRALKESFGDQKVFIFELHDWLDEIERVGASRSWIDFGSWAKSVTGVPLWSNLTDMEINAPVGTVSVGVDGIRVNP